MGVLYFPCDKKIKRCWRGTAIPLINGFLHAIRGSCLSALWSFQHLIAHIINLFNGADIIPTLLQICYATSIGFLFVIIFCKSKSLIPCILAHAVNNSLSIFVEENSITLYIAPIFLIIVPIIYSIYIIKNYKKKTMVL